MKIKIKLNTNIKKMIAITLIVIGLSIILGTKFIWNPQNTTTKNNPLETPLETKPKYIFLFIGDGMSSAQVELTEIYQNVIDNKKVNEQDLLSFSNFPTVGLRKNYSQNDYTPDSSASATALATGILTYNGAVNVDINGKNITPLTYDLKKDGKKIGIITTVPLNHATPAGFYAHNSSRNNYKEIANDLFESDFEYFAGGGILEMNINEITTKAKEHGYTVSNNIEQLNSIDKNKKNIVISPNANSSSYLPIALDNKTDFNLANYVKKGIEVLDNENGFFIMAESGMIDSAGHNSDARSVISEVQELDYAVKIALDFASKHPKETLIIVTGDHETGGLTLGNTDYDHKLSLTGLKNQKHSYEELNKYSYALKYNNTTYEEMLDYLKNEYGIINVDLQGTYNEVKNGNNEIFSKSILEIINKNAGLSFTTTYHTADRIPIYVYGENHEKFSGIYDSSEFNQILRKSIK